MRLNNGGDDAGRTGSADEPVRIRFLGYVFTLRSVEETGQCAVLLLEPTDENTPLAVVLAARTQFLDMVALLRERLEEAENFREDAAQKEEYTGGNGAQQAEQAEQATEQTERGDNHAHHETGRLGNRHRRGRPDLPRA